MSDKPEQPTRPAAFAPRMAWRPTGELERLGQERWRSSVTLSLSESKQITVSRTEALALFSDILRQCPEFGAYFEQQDAQGQS